MPRLSCGQPDPDLRDAEAPGRWGEHLAACCGDGGVICAVASLAGYVDWVAMLEDVGAQRPLLVASAAGAGAVMRFLDRERGRRSDAAPLSAPELGHVEEHVRELGWRVQAAVGVRCTRPTELNSRMSAGAACLAHALGGSLLDLLQRNLR